MDEKVKPPKIPPRIKPVELLSWKETTDELTRIQKQFCVIHDLPKQDGAPPAEYMRETLEGLRERCIALNWHRISLTQLVYNKRQRV